MKTLSLRLLATLALAPLAFAGLEENLPATTFGLIKIENITKSRARLEAHPVGKAPGAAKIREFFAPGLNKLRAEEAGAFTEFEKIRESLGKHLTGEFVLAVVQTPNPLPGHIPIDYVTLAETDADEAAIATLLKDAKLFQPTPNTIDLPAPAAGSDKTTPQSDDESENDEENEPMEPVAGRAKPKIEMPKLEAVEEEFAGVKLHLLTTKVDDKPVGLGGWALVNRTFVYASAPNVLKELVEARKSGRKDAFTDTAIYKSGKDAIADRDGWMLINPPIINGAVREVLVNRRDEARKAGKPAPGGGMFDPIKTFDAMAFDNMTHIRISMSLNPDDTRIDTSIGWKEFKGIVTLLQYKADEKPETFLAPADAISVDAGRIDLSATLAVLEGMIRDAFPFAAPMLDVQLDKMKNEEGLDIRSALLANFGDSIVTITGEASAGASPIDAMPQVWALSIKDETKLASFIETVLGKVASQQTGDGTKSVFDEREIMGVKVRDIKTGGASVPRIAYALHKNHLLISKGDPVLLNKVIGQLVDPKSGIDTTPAHRAGLARLPEGGCGVNHADLGRLANTVCSAISTSVNNAMTKNGNNADSPFDTSKTPESGDFPFVIVGKAYSTPTGIESHAVLVPKVASDAK